MIMMMKSFNSRGSSLSSSHMSRSYAKRAFFALRRSFSPSLVTICVALLLGFSLFAFLYSMSQISRVEEEEEKPFFSDQPREISRVEEEEEKPFFSDQPREDVVEEEQLWDASFGYGYQPCAKPKRGHQAPQDLERYLTLRSNGGLNQMRTGISDMVAVARILNATLVIPQLDKRSFWQDSSTFADIFDELHFIKTLQGDVRIVKELPKGLESVPRARKHFTTWSGMGYYIEIAELWKNYQVIHVPKSDSRLANNDLPLDIQRLRCRALYHALRFSASIENLGKVLSIRHGDPTEAGGAFEVTRTIYRPSPTV